MPDSVSSMDELVAGLQALRAESGNPSYGEIASRIAAARKGRGVPDHAASVARTTVYDAFRLGRRRINVDLVAEIVQALGADGGAVDAWKRACSRAHHPISEALSVNPSTITAEPADPSPSQAGGLGLRLMAACLAINLVGGFLVQLLSLPLYLDMIGTAVSAAILGPWRGAAVGAATQILAMSFNGVPSLPFMVVNVAGALIWGYGVHRFGMGRTLGRFFTLTVVVALACTGLAVPILLLLFDGSTGHLEFEVAKNFQALGMDQVKSVLWANVVTSQADKLVAGFLTLVVAEALGKSPILGSTSGTRLGLFGPTRAISRPVT